MILRDLHKKMVLLAGPRQAGKTTLAKEIATEFSSSIYLNYDHLQDRNVMVNEAWLPTHELIILDEIHKMPNWKGYLKGVYDTKAPHQKLIVTGSARLEIFNQVGDSLAGRYFLHRLFPLSLAELSKLNMDSSIDRFLERGSFPEPFLVEEKVDADRWRLQYVDSLLRTDVLEFDNIQNLNNIRLIFELLREKVGSPISFSSIAEDVNISPNTVKKYIEILEALYIIFRVVPHTNNIARSLLKSPKIYFFDTGLVKGSEGIRFENFIAFSLLKHVHYKIDYEAKNYSLRYLHTKEGKEVDFAITEDEEVKKIIEVKLSSQAVGSSLKYFHKKYDLPSMQIVKNLKTERMVGKIEIADAKRVLENLDL